MQSRPLLLLGTVISFFFLCASADYVAVSVFSNLNCTGTPYYANFEVDHCFASNAVDEFLFAYSTKYTCIGDTCSQFYYYGTTTCTGEALNITFPIGQCLDGESIAVSSTYATVEGGVTLAGPGLDAAGDCAAGAIYSFPLDTCVDASSDIAGIFTCTNTSDSSSITVYPYACYTQFKKRSNPMSGTTGWSTTGSEFSFSDSFEFSDEGSSDGFEQEFFVLNSTTCDTFQVISSPCSSGSASDSTTGSSTDSGSTAVTVATLVSTNVIEVSQSITASSTPVKTSVTALVGGVIVTVGTLSITSSADVTFTVTALTSTLVSSSALATMTSSKTNFTALTSLMFTSTGAVSLVWSFQAEIPAGKELFAVDIDLAASASVSKRSVQTSASDVTFLSYKNVNGTIEVSVSNVTDVGLVAYAAQTQQSNTSPDNDVTGAALALRAGFVSVIGLAIAALFMF